MKPLVDLEGKRGRIVPPVARAASVLLCRRQIGRAEFESGMMLGSGVLWAARQSRRIVERNRLFRTSMSQINPPRQNPNSRA